MLSPNFAFSCAFWSLCCLKAIVFLDFSIVFLDFSIVFLDFSNVVSDFSSATVVSGCSNAIFSSGFSRATVVVGSCFSSAIFALIGLKFPKRFLRNLAGSEIFGCPRCENGRRNISRPCDSKSRLQSTCTEFSFATCFSFGSTMLESRLRTANRRN